MDIRLNPIIVGVVILLIIEFGFIIWSISRYKNRGDNKAQQVGKLPQKNLELKSQVQSDPHLQILSTKKKEPFVIKTNIKKIKALLFLDKEEIIIGGADGKVSLWQISNGSEKNTYMCHTRQVLQAKSTGYDYFATSSEDGLICLWNKFTGGVDNYFDFGKLHPPTKLKFYEDSDKDSDKDYVSNILPGTRSDNIFLFPNDDRRLLPVYVWNSRTSQIFHLGGAEKVPIGIKTGAINNKGDFLIISSNTAIIGYDVMSGKIKFEFGGVPKAYSINDQKNIFLPLNPRFENIALQIACGNHTMPITCIEFSKHDQFFATGSEDKSVRIWDFEQISINSKKGIRNYPNPIVFNGHNNRIISIAFLENDELLLGACQDGTIIIWEIYTKKIVKKIASNLEEITSFAMSSDRQKIAFGSNGGLVQIISI